MAETSPEIDARVIDDLIRERARARVIHAAASIDDPRAMSDWQRLAILVAEVGEVAQALLDGDPAAHLYEELIQVGSVATTFAAKVRKEIVGTT